MNLSQIITAMAAFIVSLGGGGAIVFGVSSWLGKIWANRFMQAEQQKHAVELEQLRSQLRRQQELELERLRASHSAEIDVLIRRREVYQKMVSSMHIHLPRNMLRRQKTRKLSCSLMTIAICGPPTKL
jgi:hypothetical protein